MSSDKSQIQLADVLNLFIELTVVLLKYKHRLYFSPICLFEIFKTVLKINFLSQKLAFLSDHNLIALT